MSKLLAPPLLYLITNRQQYSPHTHLQFEAIAKAAQSVPPQQLLIQIREKDLPTSELCEFARAAISLARPHGARILVNDRLDVALATGADGVHLRTDSLPTAVVRRLVKTPNFLIGVSTHSMVEAQLAESSGADFIVCGPVFPTASKAQYGLPLGLEPFAAVCQSVKIPVLALGGISMSNFSDVISRGASGIAAISLFKNIDALGSNIKIVLSSPLNPQD